MQLYSYHFRANSTSYLYDAGFGISRPGNLLSSACLVFLDRGCIECVDHVQAKDGFQVLCVDGRSSKISYK